MSYGSGQQYDIFVYNEQNEEVFKWSNNKAFTSALIVRNLLKEGKLTFNEEWSLKNNKGNPIPPGNYTIVVRVMIGITSKTINPDDLTAKTILEVI
ncbi:BsuPI-related putative proteinase inhibitor [Paenibacillus agricola]|uniref:Intracellular proteinase inhibitor BsuPI domain-containing protein n=1 Tax=Paenibacillus agricola TaxID=2716264 RepID=A0ABX0JFB6_9BACL|nr:hypothetical protein [Paenibacillus agricola]